MIKLGMIGGGPGAFIGAVHRAAARLDGLYTIAAGAFSSDPEKSRQTGAELGLPSGRIYTSWQEMLEREADLPEGERIEVVSIVTPNHLHLATAKAAIERGFHVVLDKPMTLTLDEGRELYSVVKGSDRLFCLTHTYAGYPMIKEARELVRSGKLGTLRKVRVAYPQGWLHVLLEATGAKQAEWRTDPARNGAAGGMGDIGTHAFHLAEYITGLKVERLCADLNIYVPGRAIDDDGAVLLRFNGGASGILEASQVMAGEENDLRIKVYGEHGGLEWRHNDLNSLLVKWPDAPAQIYRTGNGYLSGPAKHNTRTPAGHPEGYIEAFANLYRNVALCLKARKEGREPDSDWTDFPGAEEGLRGMLFIQTVLQSAASDQKWTAFLQ